MSSRSVTISGATGLIGSRLVDELSTAGWQVTVLTRNPERARERLGSDVEAHAWDLLSEAAPAEALSGRGAAVGLAGRPVSPRRDPRAAPATPARRRAGHEKLLA